MIEQWNEIERCSIQMYALLRIVGSPGTGKFCAAQAFAYALDRKLWDVIWIHYSRDGNRFHCVQLCGNDKQTCIIEGTDSTMMQLLNRFLDSVSDKKRTIVFLDGCVDSIKEVERARLICNQWHLRNKDLHRLVCVCSMEAYRNDLSPYCTTNDVKAEGPSESVNRVAKKERKVREREVFTLKSWTLQKYTEAIANEVFYSSIKDKLRDERHHNGTDQPTNISSLEEKYFVAGGSARLMFDSSIDEAIVSLDNAISLVSYVEDFIKPFPSAIQLLACYRDLKDVHLVSNYVVRRLVSKFPRLLHLGFWNPMVPQSVFLEGWFLAHLHRDNICWTTMEGQACQNSLWKRSEAIVFDPDEPTIQINVDSPLWLASTKRKWGGYDLVFVDHREGVVRFIQFARAKTGLTFQADCFVNFLKSPAVLGLPKKKKHSSTLVELCYVVHVNSLQILTSPVSEESFASHVAGAAKGCELSVTVHGVQADR